MYFSSIVLRYWTPYEDNQNVNAISRTANCYENDDIVS